jgi:nucleoside transporter
MLVSIQLGIMMFLEYAIWGAWTPILTQDVAHFGFTGTQVGWLYGALPLGCMVAPLIGGQFVDRWMPTQIFLGIAHLLGAVFLWLMSAQTTFPPMMVHMLIWSILFAPTMAFTNSICFIHLKNSDRDFPIIRTMGTIGWIVAGLALTAWRVHPDVFHLPGHIDSLALAAACSLALGLFCFLLPNTPPSRATGNPYAFLEALKMFRNPKMAFFLLLCMVATTEFQFFYQLSAPFLKFAGVTEAYIPAVKTVSQGFEIGVLAIGLPLLLPVLGIRWCLLIGLIAWPLRYLIFVFQKPLWLIIASLGLHGFGFAFYFIVAFMYLDRVSPKNIRGSAQGLITFATYGLGMFVGARFCGKVQDFYTVASGSVVSQDFFGWLFNYATPGGAIDWRGVFLVPTLITSLCAVAHWLWFREASAAEVAAATGSRKG